MATALYTPTLFHEWQASYRSFGQKLCSCFKRNFEINKLANKAFLDKVAEESIEQPELRSKCLKELKLDKLLEILKANDLLQEDLQTIIASLHEVNQELEPKKKIKSQRHDYFRNPRKILDTLLSAFSVFSLIEGSTTTFEASQVISAYSRMLAVPFAMFTALNILLKNAASAIISTACVIILCSFAIFMYLKYLKPFPYSVEGFKDCTALAREGVISPIICQENYLLQIQAYLQAGDRVLVVGPAGAGKNSVAIQELARRMAAGETIENFKFKYLLGGSVSNLFSNYGDDANKLAHLLFAIDQKNSIF